MRSVIIISVFAIVFVLPVSAQMKQSEAGDRTAVSITVYNQNLSLIREERTINFADGTSSVIVPDIPQTIDGTSLSFSSLTDPSSVQVLEQNYQYDLVNQAKLLSKYIGHDVEFIRLSEETKKEYTVSGKLLSAGWMGNGSDLVAEIDGKIELNPSGRLVLPALPDGLILKPQLQWLVKTNHPGEHKTEISYLASSLSWDCNYVALINKEDSNLALTGWVTLTNNSGTSFKHAALKLVAGDLNVVNPNVYRDRGLVKAMAAADENRPQFQQTDLFEYKLYTLQRPTDLDNEETKQIELVSGKSVSAKKVLVYDGLADQWKSWQDSYDYRSQGTFGQQSNKKVGVYITFKNSERAGLGIALPKGKVRVYKKDDDGKEEFIGEDQIDHTPKDEEIRLYLGNAFDVVGERSQVDFQSSQDGHIITETIRINVRNHKSEPVEVQVYEHPWRWNQWKITTSAEYEKVDQSTVRFPVKLAKDGEKTIDYTITYTW